MKRLTQKDVLDLVRDKIDTAGSQKEFASQANISPQYLSDVLHNRRSPGPAVLNSLGLKEVRYYERKEKKR